MTRVQERWSRWSGLLFGRDPRDEREVEGDIDDEIAFHLAARAKDLERGGLPPHEAEAEALRRFGDVSHIRAACWRVQNGGRIMMQRVMLALMVVLLAAVGLSTRQSVVSQRAAKDEIRALQARVEDLLTRLEAGASATANPSMTSTPSEVLQGDRIRVPALDSVPAAVWIERLQSRPTSEAGVVAEWLVRETTLNARGDLAAAIAPQLDDPRRMAFTRRLWSAGDWVLTRRLAHGMALSASSELRRAGIEATVALTLAPLDPTNAEAYAAWDRAHHSAGLDEIVPTYARELMARLSAQPAWNAACVQDAARVGPLTVEVQAGVVQQALIEAGAIDLIARWAVDPDPAAQVAALDWLLGLEFDGVTRLRWISTMLERPGARSSEFLAALCRLLATEPEAWSARILMAELDARLARSPYPMDEIGEIADALSATHADFVLPEVLARVFRANDPDLTQLLAQRTLCPLANEDPAMKSDRAWWVSWWMVRRTDFTHPTDSSGMPLVSHF